MFGRYCKGKIVTLDRFRTAILHKCGHWEIHRLGEAYGSEWLSTAKVLKNDECSDCYLSNHKQMINLENLGASVTKIEAE